MHIKTMTLAAAIAALAFPAAAIAMPQTGWQSGSSVDGAAVHQARAAIDDTRRPGNQDRVYGHWDHLGWGEHGYHGRPYGAYGYRGPSVGLGLGVTPYPYSPYRYSHGPSFGIYVNP